MSLIMSPSCLSRARPVTLPLREADVTPPCAQPGCQYTEGLAVGWRRLHGQPVAFAFGHGLSYTTFEYSWASPSEIEISSADYFSTYTRCVRYMRYTCCMRYARYTRYMRSMRIIFRPTRRRTRVGLAPVAHARSACT